MVDINSGRRILGEVPQPENPVADNVPPLEIEIPAVVGEPALVVAAVSPSPLPADAMNLVLDANASPLPLEHAPIDLGILPQAVGSQGPSILSPFSMFTLQNQARTAILKSLGIIPSTPHPGSPGSSSPGLNR
jgi:hypothetical protein